MIRMWIVATAATLALTGITAMSGAARADLILIGGTPALSFRDLGGARLWQRTAIADIADQHVRERQRHASRCREW
jgi:hypothetical protein